ncbi:MAG: 50S ribosomal protein L10 [Parcubacteria group bacterium]|nr:50S ribosomal protein L10 [Parcubacteria group bacterium]
MPISKQHKSEIIQKLVRKLQTAKSVVFVQFSGIPVSELETLRRKVKLENSEYLVAKKTLLRKAFEAAQMSDIDPTVVSRKELAVIMSYADEVTGAKLAKEFGKTHEPFEMVASVLTASPSGQRMLDAVQTQALANIPAREVLLAKVVSSIASPLSGMVNVLAGNLRSLVYVLSAVKDKKAA